jgi:hypothetical protein
MLIRVCFSPQPTPLLSPKAALRVCVLIALVTYGIGVSNPTSRLSIAGGSLATGNYNLNIATGLTTGRAGTYGTGSLSAIHTYFDETSVEMSAGSSNGWVSAVSVTGLTGANYAGTVRFSTVSAERMRIDSAGQVGIGTSSPAYILDISGNTAGLVTTRIINLNSGASAYSYLRMGNNADSDAGILRNSSTNTAYGGAGSLNLYQGGARSIGFVTDNVERMRINAGAPILCLAGGNTSATGTGIAFPGTQSASSDANTLDDYEEGASGGISGRNCTSKGIRASICIWWFHLDSFFNWF